MENKKRIIKTCKHHGETLFTVMKNGKSCKGEIRYMIRCMSCRNDYIKDRRSRHKEKILTLLGSGCAQCGYNRFLQSLDLHHLDPGKKEHNVGAILDHSWKLILSEIENCILLCRNCHRELHGGFITIEEILNGT